MTGDPTPANAPDRPVSLVEHARRELELLGEFNPGAGDPAYAQSILAAIAAFASFGHSGGSAMDAADVLHRLLGYGNLTPLTSDPGEWVDRTEQSSGLLWQSVRNPKAFSDDRAVTYWFVDDENDVSEIRDGAGEVIERHHAPGRTRYRTVAPGIPPFRQDPYPLPPPIGSGFDEPCTRITAATGRPMPYQEGP